MHTQSFYLTSATLMGKSQLLRFQHFVCSCVILLSSLRTAAKGMHQVVGFHQVLKCS